MFKKKDDDNKTQAERDAQAARDAITDRDGTESRRATQQQPDDGGHRSIIADARNPETDDGSVNPHNEAMAQKPVAIPLDRQADTGKDGDQMDKFRQWMRRNRLGGPSGAAWEEFEVMLGDRRAHPQPASSIPAGARSAAEDAGATPSVETSGNQDASRSQPKRA